MTAFTPGLELARAFYAEAVRPILDAAFPGLRHTAALIGSGSEVLGFDTEQSADHHWGPRVLLFLAPEDHARCAAALTDTLSRRLPPLFGGYPTNFTPPNPDDNGVQLLQTVTDGPINHRVEALTLAGFLNDYLGIDPFTDWTTADWLALPGQKLRTLTAGAVFHDDDGDLTRLRARLAYYPHDVWLYLLAAGWARIGEEEHLLGRAGQAGDELGSRLIAARLVHDLMNLWFLMARVYPPYSKWFGTAFARLNGAPALAPTLHAALDAHDWPTREAHLCRAYEAVAARHNALGITDPLPTQVTPFFGRPFRVIWGGRFSDALLARITDTDVQRIAAWTLIGAVEQFSTSTALLSEAHLRPALAALYRP